MEGEGIPGAGAVEYETARSVSSPYFVGVILATAWSIS